MPLAKHPERILQIGDGNFLRCFVGWQVDILNEKNGLDAGIVVVRPVDPGTPPSLNSQDGLYTTLLRGYDEQGAIRNEKRVISAVTREISIYCDYAAFLELAKIPELRFIVSNTTEAGIAYSDQDAFDDRPPATYPAKLTRFLYQRFLFCQGSMEGGFVLLPCELIDYNGEKLKEIVLKYVELWELPPEFSMWLEQANTFCSTLVDRIVTGYPKDEAERLTEELGYQDQFMVAGEYFHLFVIQAPPEVGDALKIAGSGLNIELVEDLKLYKERKVGILNGCHTALTPVAYLSGVELVKDALADPSLETFLEHLLDREIIPCLSLSADELQTFARSVIRRFKNPYIKHKLLDISLNSMTKFKTRILPQFIRYYRDHGTAPPLMTLALSALICFYRGNVEGRAYSLKDDPSFLDLYQNLWSQVDAGSFDLGAATAVAREILGLEEHWGVSLLSMDGVLDMTSSNIHSIVTKGMKETLKEHL